VAPYRFEEKPRRVSLVRPETRIKIYISINKMRNLRDARSQ
jgi:hypothetical protein